MVPAWQPLCAGAAPDDNEQGGDMLPMSRNRTRLVLVLAGLAAVVSTAFGAQAASADESPRVSGASSADVPVVHDPGLASSPRVDSGPDLQSCYGGAKPWDVGTADADGDPRYIPGWDDAPDATVGRGPVYVASDRCNDVNLQVTSPRSVPVRVRVCFFPTSGGYYCNDWTTIAPDDADWVVIATALINGTRFEVEFENPGEYLTGNIAY
jgi:hypothetical protein